MTKSDGKGREGLIGQRAMSSSDIPMSTEEVGNLKRR